MNIRDKKTLDGNQESLICLHPLWILKYQGNIAKLIGFANGQIILIDPTVD